MAGTISDFLANPKGFIFGNSADTFTAELTAQKSKITELEASLAKAAADFSDFNAATAAKLSKLTADLTASQAALTAESAKLATAEARAVKAEATIADPKGEVQRLAALKASEITASQGIAAPLPQGKAAASSSASELKGLARATALHKESMEQSRISGGQSGRN